MCGTLQAYKEDRNPNNILAKDPEGNKFLGGSRSIQKVDLTEAGCEGVD
jgi:hypothetical protein